MKKNSIKISLVLNIIILIFVIFACIVMFTGYKFMHGYEIVLDVTSLGMFKFYTVDSNVLIGIASLLFIIDEIKILKGTKKEISLNKYLFKLMCTSSVALTFLIVFIYLGPISAGGIPCMLQNSNLFFHLIIPVLSIITFIIFERTNKISFKKVIYGIIPTVLYEIYYLINVLIHMEHGKISPIYDWYWFIQGGVWTAIIIAPVMLLLVYFISFILWKINRIK